MDDASKAKRRRANGVAKTERRPILVQKFGGTSVASLTHISRAAERAIAAHDAGSAVVVVVSAMSGETDRLLALARQVTLTPEPRELDVLAATGEQITAALTAMTIASLGRPAMSFLGHQVRITTDSTYGDARIHHVDEENVLDAVADGKIAVLAGFQGVDLGGNITTLGRGGSDTTAVALAAALQAEACEIYTDVNGVYTADPNVCPAARRLPRVSYQQMLAFASLGGKVLHHRSVALGMKYKIPIHVRTSFSNEAGTWVQDDDEPSGSVSITGIAHDKNLTLIRVTHPGPQEIAEVVTALAEHKIKLDRAASDERPNAQSEPTTTLLIRKADADRALSIANTYTNKGVRTEINRNLARVSIVGSGLRQSRRLAGRVLRWLRDMHVPVYSLIRTEHSLGFLIDASRTADVVCALHESLGLAADSEAPPPSILQSQPGSLRSTRLVAMPTPRRA